MAACKVWAEFDSADTRPSVIGDGEEETTCWKRSWRGYDLAAINYITSNISFLEGNSSCNYFSRAKRDSSQITMIWWALTLNKWDAFCELMKEVIQNYTFPKQVPFSFPERGPIMHFDKKKQRVELLSIQVDWKGSGRFTTLSSKSWTN